MSSAVLEILDKDLNVVGYGEYHGTSDTLPPEFVVDYEKEMKGKRPYFLGWPDEECNHDDNIDVILFSNYGGTNYWPSKVCMKCKVITGMLALYEPEEGYIPNPPEEKEFWRKFHADGWPKRGDPRKSDALSD
jgi:hypothetical protein